MSSLILFLDEESKINADLDRENCIKKIKQLISVIRSLKKVNSGISINSANKIGDIEVSNNWVLSSALGGNDYKEEWEYLRFLSSQTPLSKNIEYLLADIDRSECVLQPVNKVSKAVHYAYFLDTCTVSFHGEESWDAPYVNSIFKAYNEDIDEIDEHEITTRNSSQLEHVTLHRQWLDQLILGKVANIDMLWQRREEIFSRLVLLDITKDQISALTYGTVQYHTAIAALQRLNRAAMNWTDPDDDPKFETKTTPESETRRRLSYFFDHTTGKSECFEWHSRFTGDIAGRVHFRLDRKSLVLVVAYIGKKLE